MKKILIINVNWLGDVIFSTPAIRALRKHYPGAYISCLVVCRCEEVLKNNPFINEIIVYDEYGKHKSLFSKIKFIGYLRKKKFDVVYVLHPALRRAMIGYLAGISQRIGYSTKARAFLLTKAITPPEELIHKIDYFLYLLKKCAIAADNRECDFFINASDEEEAEKILLGAGIKKGEPYVVVNPGGNWLQKRWPVNNFAQVSDLLIENKGVKIIIAGGKKDIELAEEIFSCMRNSPYLITGKTNLHQLAAIMKKSRCVVSSDSGPLHISAAVGANTVAVFGPTSSRLTGPVGRGKIIILQKDAGCDIPCYQSECVENRCMKLISAREVYDKICMFLE